MAADWGLRVVLKLDEAPRVASGKGAEGSLDLRQAIASKALAHLFRFATSTTALRYRNRDTSIPHSAVITPPIHRPFQALSSKAPTRLCEGKRPSTDRANYRTLNQQRAGH